jgi:GntR family transcriptional regulator
MLGVKVDRAEPRALHDQVAASIRRAIATGEAHVGERLPPAKDLAAVLGVNTNTVLRALRDLRDDGIVEFRRGRGVTVTANPGDSAVRQASRDLVDLARRNGYQRQELLDLIASLPA